MIKKFRPGAVGALLDEYERAILDLRKAINDISERELTAIVDHKTSDVNCRSIQTILAHVVRAAYGYAIRILNLKGLNLEIPEKLFRLSVSEFQNDLTAFFTFTVDTFSNTEDNELEQFDNNQKILSAWGQVYDIEQMMEYAIVHILRHRRQIEKFKILLRR